MTHFLHHPYRKMACPPHFYNGGLNPQYPAFKKLSEWCGGGYMQLPEIASKLGRAHVEFDFVPMDYLMEADATCEKLQVYQCAYKALLIPGAEILPQAMCHKLEELFSQGIRVIYVGEKPCKTENGNPVQLCGRDIRIMD